MPYLCTTMRKKLLFAILGMMAIISCNSKGQTRPADSKDSVAVDTIAPETSDDLRKDSSFVGISTIFWVGLMMARWTMEKR